jgi:adenylate cyclase
VSNTDRFNRDCGYPPVRPARVPLVAADEPVTNARRLQTRVLGMPIEWDEFAFEWVAPNRFGVERRYHRGPLARMIVACALQPSATGGTTATYEVRVTPANWAGRIALPYTIGRRARAIVGRVFREYDQLAQQGRRISALARPPELASGGAERLAGIARLLINERGQPPLLTAKLQELIASGDDLSVARIRPYAMADEWQANRRETLHLFLHATRAGALDFSWDLVCPHCRGAKAGPPTLSGIEAHGHCDSCQTDFEANFDQSVELTFRPNAAIRSVQRADYCVGGPQVTPHIVAQQHVPAGSRRSLHLQLTAGRYRIRSPGIATQRVFRADPAGAPLLAIALGADASDEPGVAPNGEMTIVNATAQAQLAIVEHLAWTDQATTAAEVTSLQLFRDLFSREVLRPGEQISVGAMTIVFTDLKGSTQLYREIGDAPAFGRVLTHFEILKATVAAEGGAIVKTMGDAVMAVFPRPLAAVRAMLRAHRWLADPDAEALPAGITVPRSSLKPLALKAGLHIGACLAINQNDRLDYFGTTVNTAARLCSHCSCSGSDLVLSAAVCADPEVRAFLDAPDAPDRLPEYLQLKGLGDQPIAVTRLATSAGKAGERLPLAPVK